MRILVTGVDSFIGSHLAEAFVRSGDEVIGLSHRRSDASDGITRHAIDIVDATAVAAKQIEFLREDSPLRPTSPYAVSKVAQGALATVYARAHHMPILHVRLF